jgi:hydrogenase expression/formation protein HypD
MVMKYLEEFRNPEIARTIINKIKASVTKPWVIMEICGGQTHAILRNAIDRLLPSEIELVHGPGCPVCVTPLELIDQAIAIAGQPNVIFVSFGDMLRVPGSEKDLFTVKSEGGGIRIVYNPLDAVRLAQDNPDKKVVFFGVGFETTAPATAMSVWQAHQLKLDNFSLLASHVLVPPAMTALLESPDNRVQAYLAAGHVCTVMGWHAYEEVASKYNVPIVVTGFEPVDLLDGILGAVTQLEAGEARVENKYTRVVRKEGNTAAQDTVNRVFEVIDRTWRGIGVIPKSGLGLREEFEFYDAARQFNVEGLSVREPSVCISGLVLKGVRKPNECPAFGRECTPQTPLGATMVSSEGACAAYYNYGRSVANVATSDGEGSP